MKQDRKIIKTVLVLVLILVSFNSISGTVDVGSRFTYQGELHDDGSPANGSYDMWFRIYSSLTGGAEIDELTINDVEVSNGLFSVELDFGNAIFNGEEYYLEILVQNFDAVPGFLLLSPRQRINATPYAIQSEFTENSSSPWVEESGDIMYVGGSVSVGAISPGNYKLVVRGASGQNPLYASVDGIGQVFAVRSSGGVNIGSNAVPPEKGIHVDGDAQQQLGSHGFVKAGTFIQCGGAGASGSSVRYFNHVNSLDFSTTGFSTGSCKINIPFDISDLYFTVSSAPTGGLTSGSLNASCALSTTGTNELFCNINSSFGSLTNGELQLLFY